MALTQISTQGIKDGTITGSDLATNVDLVDNQKLRLGTGNDLQIYHNGNHSYIEDTGTGNLILKSNVFRLRSTGDEEMIIANENGNVQLYHNNVKKLETTSSGVSIDGNITAGDNNHLFLGDSQDINIYHDGSDSYFYSGASTLFFRNASNEKFASFISNGAVELYYDNSKKFETTSGGVQVTDNLNMSGGHIFLADNYKLNVGTGDDLQIYHNGSHSRILDAGVGKLQLGSDTEVEILNASFNETMAKFQPNGAVELYYDNVQSLRTNSTGIMVQKTASGTNASVSIDATNGGQAKLELKTTLSGTNRAARIDMYNQNSLQWSIFNDYEQDGTNDFSIRHGAEKAIRALTDGAVELYHDNSKKFETTSYGAKVTGRLAATTSFTGSDNVKLILGDSDDLQIFHDGSTNIIDGRFHPIELRHQAEVHIKCVDDGAVKLYHNNTERFETVSNGFRLAHSTGNVEFHFNRFIVNAGQTFFIDHTATGADFQFRTSDSSGLDTTALQIIGSGCLYNRCRSSSQASLTLRKQVTGANGIDYLQCRNQNNDLRMVVEGDGDVKNTNNSYGSTSDLKLKENIVDASSQWNDIKAIKVRNFNFIEDSEKTKMLGVVAQEIETSSPNLVYESIDRDPDTSEDLGTKTKNVRYSVMYMKAIKCLQEAMAKIEILETEVAALKAG